MNKRIMACLFVSFVFFGCGGQNKFDAVTYFMESGNLEKAELILKHCSKREKNTFEYNHLMGILFTKKTVANYKRDALNSLLKAHEYDSDNYLNTLLISKMYIEVNDLRNAETFALMAKNIYTSQTEDANATLDDALYYLLAKIYLKKRDYDNAYKNIKAMSFQDDVNIAFLQTEISDLKNGTSVLDSLFQKCNDEKLLTDKLQMEYMNYLFLNVRIEDAEMLADSFLENDSTLLKKYGCLFKAYIDMLKGDLKSAEQHIEKSHNYEVLDPLWLTQKMRVFYNFLTETDPIRISNSFLIYIWIYENDDKATMIAKEDLTEIYEYFKDDIYFDLLFLDKILTIKLGEVAKLDEIKEKLLTNSKY